MEEKYIDGVSLLQPLEIIGGKDFHLVPGLGVSVGVSVSGWCYAVWLHDMRNVIGRIMTNQLYGIDRKIVRAKHFITESDKCTESLWYNANGKCTTSYNHESTSSSVSSEAYLILEFFLPLLRARCENLHCSNYWAWQNGLVNRPERTFPNHHGKVPGCCLQFPGSSHPQIIHNAKEQKTVDKLAMQMHWM